LAQNLQPELLRRQTTSKAQKISSFQGDLINSEYIKRNELMKLYQPPLKKHQLPENNPFLNKSIGKYQTEQNLQLYKHLLRTKGEEETLSFVSQH
jgi:hypothetical protein